MPSLCALPDLRYFLNPRSLVREMNPALLRSIHIRTPSSTPDSESSSRDVCALRMPTPTPCGLPLALMIRKRPCSHTSVGLISDRTCDSAPHCSRFPCPPRCRSDWQHVLPHPVRPCTYQALVVGTAADVVLFTCIGFNRVSHLLPPSACRISPTNDVRL